MSYKVLFKKNKKKFIEVGLCCILTSLIFLFLNIFRDMTENDLLQATVVFILIYYVFITIFGFSLVKDKILESNDSIDLFIYQSQKQKLYLNKLKIIDIIYSIAYIVSIIVPTIVGKLTIHFIITSFFSFSFFITFRSILVIKKIANEFEEVLLFISILLFGTLIFEYYSNSYLLFLGGVIYSIANIVIHIFMSKWRYKSENKKSNSKLFE